MAKPKTDPTPAQKALLDARQKHETAVKNDTAKSTEATKKAVVDAKAALSAASETARRDNFIRVGAPRVKKARAAIKNIGNLASPSYKFSESDIALIEKGLGEISASVVAKLRSSLTKGPAATKEDDTFAFA